MAIYGEGLPLVMVPGMDGTGELFYRQITGLAATHRVATFRLRDDAGSMQALVDDLAGLIETISPGGEPATVIGESFGGALALNLTLSRPALVRELVVVNSFPYFTPQLRLEMAIAGLQLLPWGAMGLVRRLTAFRMHSRFTHRDEIRQFLALSRGTTKEGYLGRLRILRSHDVRDRLSSIAVPTLFLASDLDHLVPSVQQAEYMAARVPGSALRVLDGHGHICLIAPNLDLAQILEEWRRERRSAPEVEA